MNNVNKNWKQAKRPYLSAPPPSFVCYHSIPLMRRGVYWSFHLRLETHLCSDLLGVAGLMILTSKRQTSVHVWWGVQCQSSLTRTSKRSLSQRNVTQRMYLYTPYQVSSDVWIWFRNKPNKNRVDCSNAYQINKTILVFIYERSIKAIIFHFHKLFTTGS